MTRPRRRSRRSNNRNNHSVFDSLELQEEIRAYESSENEIIAIDSSLEDSSDDDESVDADQQQQQQVNNNLDCLDQPSQTTAEPTSSNDNQEKNSDDNYDDEPTCPICMDSLEGKLGVTNPCGHLFHQECFGSWDAQCRAKYGYKATKCPSCNTKTNSFTHVFVNLAKVAKTIQGSTSITTPTNSAQLTKLQSENCTLKTLKQNLETKLESTQARASRLDLQIFEQKLQASKTIESLQSKLKEQTSAVLTLKSALQAEEQRCERIQKSVSEKLKSIHANPELAVVKRQVERMRAQIAQQNAAIQELENEKLAMQWDKQQTFAKKLSPKKKRNIGDISPLENVTNKPSQRRSVMDVLSKTSAPPEKFAAVFHCANHEKTRTQSLASSFAKASSHRRKATNNRALEALNGSQSSTASRQPKR